MDLHLSQKGRGLGDGMKGRGEKGDENVNEDVLHMCTSASQGA